MVAPSAVVTVNGTPIPTSGTSGINVTNASTIHIALVSSAGVNRWDVNCTQTDGINVNSTVPLIQATKFINQTAFVASFVVPPFQDIGNFSEPWNVGASMQFVSVVNAGEWNQNTFVFGVYVIGTSGLRLVFNGENLETNATYGVAPDINEVLIGRALGPAGLAGGDLLGFYPNPYVNSITGWNSSTPGTPEPVTILSPTLNWYANGNSVNPAATLSAAGFGGHISIITAGGTFILGNGQNFYDFRPNISFGPQVTLNTYSYLTLSTDGYAGTINVETANILLNGAVDVPSTASFTTNSSTANTVFNHAFTANSLVGESATFNCNVQFANGSAWFWTGFMPNAATGTSTMNADATYIAPNTEYNHLFLTVYSSVTLTTTRDFVVGGAFSNNGEFIVVRNLTTGGQSIRVKGATSPIGVTIPNGSTAFVFSDGTDFYSIGLGSGAGSITWADDLVTSGNSNQWVAAISGQNGNGGTVPLNISELAFAAGQGTPSIIQSTTSSGSGQRMLIQAQSATGGSHNGGNLVLASGQGASATDGYVALNIGGSTDGLTLNATGVVTIANLSTGVVHSDSSGNLTSSLIVNADVSGSAAIAYSKLNLSNSIVNADINSSAAIAYSKLNLTGSIVNADISSSAAIAVSKFAIGSADQLLDTNHGATTAEWFTPGGDVSFASHNFTVIGLRGKTLASSLASIGAAQDGYVLTWVNGNSDWEAKPSTGGGSSITWASDLVNSTNTNQWVAAISGNGGGGGTVPLNITTLQWANGQSSPTINQAALAATNTATAGQNMTVKAQAGSNALSGNNNGGNGGNLMLASGTAGTHTGSGTDGTVGNIQLQLDSTTNLTLTTGTLTWADVGAISYVQTQKSGTGANNGASWTFQAQQGQQQSGSNANNNGGALTIKSGTAGTGGSGAAGVSGSVSIETGDNSVSMTMLPTGAGYSITLSSSVIDLNCGSNGLTIGGLGGVAGILHNSSGGLITSSLIVDADVSSSAAIAGSKINPNFGTQTLTAGQSTLGTITTGTKLVGYAQFGAQTVSSNYTIDSTQSDMIIFADTSGGAFTITLTNPAGQGGRVLIFKDAKQSFATHNLTIARFGSEKIDGVAANLVLSLNNEEVILTNDGVNWFTQNPLPVTFASDLVNSTYTNQYVSALSYSSAAAGGAIAINGTGTSLNWASGNTGPLITQTAPASSVSGGTPAVASTISAQTGGATTSASGAIAGVGGDLDLNAGAGGSGSGGTNTSGGAGGNVVLTPGAGGAKNGTGTVGAAGTIKLAGSQNEVVSSLKTANYTVAKGDFIIGIGTLTGAITVTLPSSPATGDTYVVSDVNGSAGAHTITISPASGNINGAGSFNLTNNYQAAKVVYTGSQWTVEAAAGTSGGGGTSVTGTGLWYSASGTLNSAAVTLTGDLSPAALSSNNLPVTVSTLQKLNVSGLKTANYTVTTSDYVVGIGTLTSSITITLPSSPATGSSYVIKDVNGTCQQFIRVKAGATGGSPTVSTKGFIVTITPASGNIDGQSNIYLTNPYQSYTLVYTGSQWSII